MIQYPMLEKDEIIADFDVELCVNDKWVCVGSIKNNMQRLVVVDFEPTVASAVRINALRATKINFVIMPEVRVY